MWFNKEGAVVWYLTIAIVSGFCGAISIVYFFILENWFVLLFGIAFMALCIRCCLDAKEKWGHRHE